MVKAKRRRPKPPTVYVYVEGDDSLRPGFQQSLFRSWREGLRGRYRFRVVMAGGNSQTASDWRKRRRQASDDDVVLLLLDSEGPVPGSTDQVPNGVSSFLERTDLATDDVYFMVQLMESWYLTNVEALATIYGNGFNAGRLPSIPTDPTPAKPGRNLESIAKGTIESALASATQDTTKGRYDRTNAKTAIAPRMLEQLDLTSIARASFHADTLLQRLDRLHNS